METKKIKVDRRPAGFFDGITTAQDTFAHYACYRGHVETVYFPVLVNAWQTVFKNPIRKPSEYTHLDIIYNGWRHHRQYEKFYSQRYVVTLANRFAQEVIKEVKAKPKRKKAKTRQRQRNLDFHFTERLL